MKKLFLLLAATALAVFMGSCSEEAEESSSASEAEKQESVSSEASSESSSSQTPAFPSDYDLSYEEYFSKEREYVDRSMVAPDTLDYRYGISEKGNLYRISTMYVRLADNSRYRYFFTVDGNVVDYGISYYELAYVVGGRSIVSSNLDGSDAKVVFELPEEIEGEITGDFFVTPELFWFRMGPTVYRVHRSSGTLDEIYTNEDIVLMCPLSNYSIEYDVYDPRWIEHLANGGNTLDWVPYRPQITYIYNSKTGEDYEAQYLEEEPYTLIYDFEFE